MKSDLRHGIEMSLNLCTVVCNMHILIYVRLNPRINRSEYTSNVRIILSYGTLSTPVCITYRNTPPPPFANYQYEMIIWK